MDTGEQIAAILNQPEHTELRHRLMAIKRGDPIGNICYEVWDVPAISKILQDVSGAYATGFVIDSLEFLTNT